MACAADYLSWETASVRDAEAIFLLFMEADKWVFQKNRL
ncbi:Unknown protein sequence [Pseudomonas amygdali pv. morsprunorum]|nr:Unknown protein sequence [Pseudomonas amygdali pv. morsprunorum]